MKTVYYVYLLKCADTTYYCGITTDVKRRIKEHNTSPIGAKYTKSRRPIVLVYQKKYKTRSEACKEEVRIKKLKRKEKELLIEKSIFP